MGRHPACAYPPNTRGWRAPWRGDWGPLSDGRSRLSRRKKTRASEALEELEVTNPTRLQRKRAEDYGTFKALGDMIADGIGRDPKATPRKLTALQKSAESEYRKLRRALVARNGKPDLAAAIAREMHRTTP